MKLISMTDFVYQIGNDENHISYEKDLAKIYNYNMFLRQELSLNMFVPCDEDGNILENTMNLHLGEIIDDSYPLEVIKYHEAREKCLFEKSDYCEILLFELYDFVEDLTYAKVNLQLTPTAIKQIEL